MSTSSTATALQPSRGERQVQFLSIAAIAISAAAICFSVASLAVAMSRPTSVAPADRLAAMTPATMAALRALDVGPGLLRQGITASSSTSQGIISGAPRPETESGVSTTPALTVAALAALRGLDVGRLLLREANSPGAATEVTSGSASSAASGAWPPMAPRAERTAP